MQAAHAAREARALDGLEAERVNSNHLTGAAFASEAGLPWKAIATDPTPSLPLPLIPYPYPYTPPLPLYPTPIPYPYPYPYSHPYPHP